MTGDALTTTETGRRAKKTDAQLLEHARALDEAGELMERAWETTDVFSAVLLEPTATTARSLLLLTRTSPGDLHLGEPELIRATVAYSPSELRTELASGNPLVVRAHQGRIEGNAYFIRGEGRFYTALGELKPAPDPDEGLRVARLAADGLRSEYGQRLQCVVFHGSWVQGEAHEQSDIDLLVVLDRIDTLREEWARIHEALDTLSESAGGTRFSSYDAGSWVQAFPISETTWHTSQKRFYKKVRREGILV